MQFKDLESPSISWNIGCHDHNPHECTHEEAFDRFQLSAHMNLREAQILNEVTYKELASIIDPQFLNQQIRADVLTGLELDSVTDDVLNFLVNSSEFTENRIRYKCSVSFDEWDETGSDPDLNYAEKARLLLWAGNIRLNCTCPSFLYWGYQYILTVLDAAINPETRNPVIRNPNHNGACCKHLNRVLRALPFYSGKIAKALKDQFG
jgi:hypothetical protein